MERGVHLERQGLRADESARAEVPESPSAESQATSRQGRLPGNQSCHTQMEGRDLLIKAVLYHLLSSTVIILTTRGTTSCKQK